MGHVPPTRASCESSVGGLLLSRAVCALTSLEADTETFLSVIAPGSDDARTEPVQRSRTSRLYASSTSTALTGGSGAQQAALARRAMKVGLGDP